MSVHVLFFARVRETLGLAGCQVEAEGLTIDALVARWRKEHGPAWDVLADDSLRCAVNQQVCPRSTRLSAGDELAFFPPVTGG